MNIVLPVIAIVLSVFTFGFGALFIKEVQKTINIITDILIRQSTTQLTLSKRMDELEEILRSVHEENKALFGANVALGNMVQNLHARMQEFTRSK